MTNFGQTSNFLLMCLALTSNLTNGFLMVHGQGKVKKDSTKQQKVASEIIFKEELPTFSLGFKHGSLVLECEAQAIPSPTIHWLKNGIRMLQGYSYNWEDDAGTFEDHAETSALAMISASSTKSRLYLDCLNGRDDAVYTCVAETPYMKATQNTSVKVARRDVDIENEARQCVSKRSWRGEPARIYMWSISRLEYEDIKVQLFCRAQGFPEPRIMWYDRENNLIQDSQDYELLENGDLVISRITWKKNMGVYTCVAENTLSTDTKTTFLYPAARD